MRVSYLYDLPLPMPMAAPIQILNTCRALRQPACQPPFLPANSGAIPRIASRSTGSNRIPISQSDPCSRACSGRSTRPGCSPVCLPITKNRGLHVILSRGETALKVASWFSASGGVKRPSSTRRIASASRLRQSAGPGNGGTRENRWPSPSKGCMSGRKLWSKRRMASCVSPTACGRP